MQNLNHWLASTCILKPLKLLILLLETTPVYTATLVRSLK